MWARVIPASQKFRRRDQVDRVAEDQPLTQESDWVDAQNMHRPVTQNAATGTTSNLLDNFRSIAMNLIKSIFLALVLSFASLASYAATINVNTATAEQLTALNGIGDTKAKAIVEYRQSHGAFKSVDQLVDVKGIGLKTVEKNRDQMTVGPAK